MKSGPNAFIGQGCRIRGRLEFCGEVVIEGAIEGDVKSHGELIVGETGVIDGKINSESVTIYGRTIGDINCSERIALQSTSKVFGNLSAPRIVINDGASFEGSCDMQLPETNIELLEESPTEKAAND